MRILVVDDDYGMADTLADILTSKGYAVVTASSGEAAISMLEQASCDVVVMDIRLPGMNGVDTLKAMKRLQPGLSAILTTAYTYQELVVDARQTGALDVIPKPLNLGRLLGLLETSPSGPPAPPPKAPPSPPDTGRSEGDAEWHLRG
jgi:DNA-binding NtrC family response regulator